MEPISRMRAADFLADVGKRGRESGVKCGRAPEFSRRTSRRTERSISRSMSRRNVSRNGWFATIMTGITTTIRSLHSSRACADRTRMRRSITWPECCMQVRMKFIARRIMICASEDVGNADPNALVVAVSAAQAVERIGMPESQIILSQAAAYVATAPKSNCGLCGDPECDEGCSEYGRCRFRRIFRISTTKARRSWDMDSAINICT